VLWSSTSIPDGEGKLGPKTTHSVPGRAAYLIVILDQFPVAKVRVAAGPKLIFSLFVPARKRTLWPERVAGRYLRKERKGRLPLEGL